MIAYSDSGEWEQVAATSKGVLLSEEGGFKGEVKVLFTSVGVLVVTDAGTATERETSTASEEASVKARSRSFALGDPDDGDVFDVQVGHSSNSRSSFRFILELSRFSLIQTTARMSSTQ